MKQLLYLSLLILFVSACQKRNDKELCKKEIFQAEKAFEKMAAEKGVAEAFYFFADDSAIISRENNSLIKGKDSIRSYYAKKANSSTSVNWTPDFIDVSDCGTLGYTYGKFVWKFQDKNGTVTELKGIFHTVWKKQRDSSWKFVWD
jgi:ketosteroid isomerase-like protein